MIKKIIIFANANVMVFNEKGQQMSKYQGRIDKVFKKILQNITKEAEVEFMDWRTGNVIPAPGFFMSWK